jgi:uncharacterized cupredoxin-like copper-binding protein
VNIRRPLLLLVPLALAAAACGSDEGDDHDSMVDTNDNSSETTDANAGAGRTVEVTMADNEFEPTTLQVDEGETVTFEFENTGAVRHDAFIGDADAQSAHETEMREAEGSDDSSDMEMGHQAADDAITVEPGDTGELTYTFDRPGKLEIGCHEAGHYTSGMKIAVTVS